MNEQERYTLLGRDWWTLPMCAEPISVMPGTDYWYKCFLGKNHPEKFHLCLTGEIRYG